MNRKIIVYILGKMLGVEGMLMLIPALVSVIYQEECAASFFLTSFLLLTISFLCSRKKVDYTGLYSKEGFVIVALIWVLWSVFGAIPLTVGGEVPRYIDAFFEIVSGFTTTGATILKDVEALPKGILFWRSFTHWIGGMGVLVLVLAFIPLTDKRSMYLMRAEVPGPKVDKLVPKARTTAKLLYGIYIFLSVVLTILLMCGGMSFFDSLIHMFGTAATGGFSSRNGSIGFYNSAYIDGVITVFMIMFGINFNIFYFLLIKRSGSVLKDEEFRVYLGLILGGTVLIAFNILSIYQSPLKAFQYAVFQVASNITTTGYETANLSLWPQFSKSLLIILMVIGSSAGSTGGGIKISRLIILWKMAGRELKGLLYPQAVSIVRMNKRRVDDGTTQGVCVYFIAYIFLFAASVLLISLENFDFPTTFGAVLASISNVGPDVETISPLRNFSGFSTFSKLVLCFDMLAGRLELFPFLILFSPSLWKRKF